MNHRKIRYARSTAWGVAIVALIALWVRSYYWGDVLFVRPTPTPDFAGLYSIRGQLTLDAVFGSGRAPNASKAWTWGRSARPQKEYEYAAVRGPLKSVFGFAILSDRDYLTLSAPNWSLLMLFISLIAAPWIRWSNRFSLRAHLIATTLIEIGLGLLVWLR